jgi:hypothetical protein
MHRAVGLLLPAYTVPQIHAVAFDGCLTAFEAGATFPFHADVAAAAVGGVGGRLIAVDGAGVAGA